MYVRQISRSNLIMIPIGLTICLVPDMIVLLLLGDTWLLAVPILAWLGVQPLMTMFENANTWAMVAMGKAKALFHARCLSSLFLVAALIGAAQFDIVTFVALFVLAQAVITFVYMPLVVTRHTPITFTTIRQAIGPDIIFCVFMGVIGVTLRTILTLPPLAEGFYVGGLICIAQGLRIGLTPHYRQDVKRLLRR